MDQGHGKRPLRIARTATQLDGVEPDVVADIQHAAAHISGMKLVSVKARWLGHKLHADIEILVDETIQVAEGNTISASFRRELFEHLPALAAANVRLSPSR